MHNMQKIRRSYTDMHVGPEVVETFLEDLTENMVIALPNTCVQTAGLQPNINDKHKPKELVSWRRYYQQELAGRFTKPLLLQWVGRMRQLQRLVLAETIKQATEPQGVRRSFLEVHLTPFSI
jgi:hypothetical protein